MARGPKANEVRVAELHEDGLGACLRKPGTIEPALGSVTGATGAIERGTT